MSEAGPPSSTNSGSTRNWTDVGPRLASAAVLIAVVAGTLYLGSYVFASVVGAVYAGVYREWETMITRAPVTPLGWILIVMVGLSGVVFPLWNFVGSAAIIALAAVFAVIVDREFALWRIAGLVLMGTVLMAVLAMRGSSDAGIIAGVYLGTVVWMTDSAAFFTGRQIGGEKLAPDISPSKTWSGALGGLALGTARGSPSGSSRRIRPGGSASSSPPPSASWGSWATWPRAVSSATSASRTAAISFRAMGA